MTELNCRWTPTANRFEYHKSIHILHRFRSLARHFAATADPHTVPTEVPVRLTPPLSWSNGSCYGAASAIAAMLATLQHFCRQYVAITIGMFYADRLNMSTWRQRTTQCVPNQYRKSSKCYDPSTGMIVSAGTV
jgi:hypothetical protein